MQNLKISEHILKRYVQRVQNLVFKNKQALNNHIYTEAEKLKQEIQDLYSQSELFYDGSIGSIMRDKRQYYIKDDFIFVCNKNELITLYHTDFGFGKDDEGNIDLLLAQRLLKKIHVNNSKIEQLKIKTNKEIEKLGMEIIELKAYRKTLTDRLDLINSDLNTKNELLKVANIKSGVVEKENQELILKLINYNKFKKSMED